MRERGIHGIVVALVIGALIGFLTRRATSVNVQDDVPEPGPGSSIEFRVHKLHSQLKALEYQRFALDKQISRVDSEAPAQFKVRKPYTSLDSSALSVSSPPSALAPREPPRDPARPDTTPSSIAPESNPNTLALGLPRFYQPSPPPSPGAWSCPHSSGCKYVFYVVPVEAFIGEQFSQQRLAMMEIMNAVKLLGPEYVLVEPHFIITPHDNNKIEARIKNNTYSNTEDTLLGRYVVSASELFDLKLLREYYGDKNGIVLYGDFIALYGQQPYLDMLLMDHPQPHPISHLPTGRQLPCLNAKDISKSMEFFNQEYTVRSTQCLKALRREGYPVTSCRPSDGNCFAAGKPYRQAFIKTIRENIGNRGGDVFIGLSLYRSAMSEQLFQWIEDPDLEYVAIRKKLLYSQSIWMEAMKFVENMPRPFTAMHIRRGDKLNKDPFSTLGKAAKRINRIVKETKSASVFLMTDIHSAEDLQMLKSQLAATNGFYQVPNNRGWRQEIQRMFLEMAICSMADYFISSGRAYWASATPSRDIIEVRNIVFRFDKETTFWFGRPGPRWTGKVIDTFVHAKDLLED